MQNATEAVTTKPQVRGGSDISVFGHGMKREQLEQAAGDDGVRVGAHAFDTKLKSLRQL